MEKTVNSTANSRVNEKAITPNSYPKTYIIGLVIGIILFIPSLLIAHTHHLNGIQLTIFRDLNNLSDSFKTAALWLTEGLGAGYPIAVLVILPLFYRRFKLAWRFFVAAGATGVVMEAAKIIAKEPRPAALLGGNLHVRAVETGLNSFPSGHEAIATALALTAWLILPKKWRWLSIVWIIIVGLSRIYLGDHTPNDIVGGFAIALIVISVIRLLPPFLATKLHLESDHTLTERGF